MNFMAENERFSINQLLTTVLLNYKSYLSKIKICAIDNYTKIGNIKSISRAYNHFSPFL